MDKTNDQNELSQAMVLLTHVWDCADQVKPFSDARFESAMNNAMTLAIKGGLTFDKEDCTRMNDKFCLGYGYYKHNVLSFTDSFYIQAIVASNMSACHSFEHCVGRKPFITNNVHHPDYLLGSMPGRWNIARPRDRLGLGSKFTWQGNKVTVTSFDDKNGKILVCSYKPRERETPCLICGRGGWETGTLKIEHVYKLTNKDLREGEID